VPALGGRVLKHQVVAGRARRRARRHLDEPAHPVLLVHHEVARLELQRVHATALAGGRQPALVARARPRRAARREVRLGEHRQPHRRPGETLAQFPGRYVRDAALRLVHDVADARAEALAAQHLGQPFGGPVPLGYQHHPPALGKPLAHVRQHAAGLAAIGARGRCVDNDSVAVLGGRFPAQLAVVIGHAEWRQRPPVHAELGGRRADDLDRLKGRAAEVDGRLAAGRGARPGCLEELLAGGDQLDRPGPDPLRVARKHHAAHRQVVEQQVHPVGEHGGERLHALHGDPVGDPPEDLRDAGVLGRQLLGAGPHRRGEQQLAAGRRPQAMLRLPSRALVGDLEDADLLDAVAEELDPQRVLLGRREHVEQPAAHGELAALGYQLDTRVADLDEPLYDVFRVGVVAHRQPHRHQVAEARHDRLQHRADRRHDGLQRAAQRDSAAPGGPARRTRGQIPDTFGVREAAQHRDPLPDGVGARRQPLVRQRLPAGERGDRLRRQERPQRGGQVLSLARGRGHREHEPARAARHPGRQRRRDQRAQRHRRDQVTLGAPGRPWRARVSGEGGAELGIFGYGGQ